MRARWLDRRQDRRRIKGVAVIETAVILPLVLFLLFGIGEIGRAIGQYNTLTKAVRDGARYLANSPTNAAGVPQIADRIASAKNLVVFGNIGGTGAPLLPGLVTGNVANPTVNAGGYITVTATYNFRPVLVPLPTFGLGSGDGITLGPYSATAVMRNLR